MEQMPGGHITVNCGQSKMLSFEKEFKILPKNILPRNRFWGWDGQKSLVDAMQFNAMQRN